MSASALNRYHRFLCWLLGHRWEVEHIKHLNVYLGTCKRCGERHSESPESFKYL